jgi:hypothetical protein
MVEASFAEAPTVLANHAAPAHGEGIGHFTLTEFEHVKRSDYQIRCSKRVEIIKLDTRYQIKRTTKPLKFMKPDSCI